MLKSDLYDHPSVLSEGVVGMLIRVTTARPVVREGALSSALASLPLDITHLGGPACVYCVPLLLVRCGSGGLPYDEGMPLPPCLELVPFVSPDEEEQTRYHQQSNDRVEHPVVG